ncbi:hypothetical protein CXB37_08365 [Pseudomonas syringae pv. syringae]|nr:hypothetical protein CXB37_08365 [Pseudomonas syringae pv. syringae]
MRRGAPHDSCGYRSLRSSVGMHFVTLCVTHPLAALTANNLRPNPRFTFPSKHVHAHRRKAVKRSSLC